MALNILDAEAVPTKANCSPSARQNLEKVLWRWSSSIMANLGSPSVQELGGAHRSRERGRRCTPWFAYGSDCLDCDMDTYGAKRIVMVLTK